MSDDQTIRSLLIEYWKAGCQCRNDSAALCDLCKRTEIALWPNGDIASQEEGTVGADSQQVCGGTLTESQWKPWTKF